MGHPPMGNHGMGNNMANAMGMIPMNNGHSQMPNSTPQSHYEYDRYHQMRYQGHMPGMNHNQMPPEGRANGPRGPSDMAPHGRYQQHGRYN